jgi:hypothetical protein
MDNKKELLKLQAKKRVQNYNHFVTEEEIIQDDILEFKSRLKINTKMVDDYLDLDSAPIASLFDEVA